MMATGPSQVSAPARAEQSTTCQLTLVALAGEEIQLPVEREFDGLDEFENSVLECLSTISTINTFECELDLSTWTPK